MANKNKPAPKPRVPRPEPTPAEEKKEIQVIERIIENREVAPADAFGQLKRSQIDLIKRTIAKGANDDELRMFIQVCKGANLNPFLKQVFLVPRWDSREGKENRVIQVSIDGFRAIAESSGAYGGNDDPIYEGETTLIKVRKEKVWENGKSKDVLLDVTAPLKATVTVYKIFDGQRFGFTATARWSEYYPGEKMGFQWHVRPYLMLGKCAEALALRKAFPKLLSGMYAQEEMDNGQEVQVQKTDSAFATLLKATKKFTMAELKTYKEKMDSSDKYSNEQKAEFARAVEVREAEIKNVVSEQ